MPAALGPDPEPSSMGAREDEPHGDAARNGDSRAGRRASEAG